MSGSHVRTHPTGARDEVELTGEAGQEILRFLHLPPGDTRAGLVICSPVFEEYQSNHHREVLLAKASVERGIAVHRFNYRGTGSSGGSAAEVTLDSMIHDAALVGEQLRARIDRPIVFVGTRLGAIVAAGAARETAAGAVAAWEPALDASRHLREVLRAQRLRELVGSDEERRSSDPFEEAGVVDVAGYPLHRALWASARDRTLEAELGPSQRDILLIQLGRDGSIRPGLARTADRLRAEGRNVGTIAVEAAETWWFSNDPTKTRGLSTRMVASTLDWVDLAVGP